MVRSGSALEALSQPKAVPAPKPEYGMGAADTNGDGIVDPGEYAQGVAQGKLPGGFPGMYGGGFPGAYGGYPGAYGGYGGYPGYGYGHPGMAPFAGAYGGYPGYGGPAAADKDGDGVVDAKEFAQGMAEGKLGGPGYGMGMPGAYGGYGGYPGYGYGHPGMAPFAGQHPAPSFQYPMGNYPNFGMDNLIAADKDGNGMIDRKELFEAVKMGRMPPYLGYEVDLAKAETIPFGPGCVRSAVHQRILQARTLSGEALKAASVTK